MNLASYGVLTDFVINSCTCVALQKEAQKPLNCVYWDYLEQATEVLRVLSSLHMLPWDGRTDGRPGASQEIFWSKIIYKPVQNDVDVMLHKSFMKRKVFITKKAKTYKAKMSYTQVLNAAKQAIHKDYETSFL